MAPAAKRKRADGRIWVWLSGASLLLILAMMAIIGFLVCANSFQVLWPSRLDLVALADGSVFLGFPMNGDISPEGLPRTRYKVGNREINSGADFRWIYEQDVVKRNHPQEALVVNRMENGDFYGFLKRRTGGRNESATESPEEFRESLVDFQRRWNSLAEPPRRRLAALGDAWQENHLAFLKAEYEMRRALTPDAAEMWKANLERSIEREEAVKTESERAMSLFNAIRDEFQAETAVFATADGTEISFPLSALADVSSPNDMGWTAKAWRFAVNVWNILSQYPREANTDGGLFPALLGTVALVFLMAVTSFPLGVAAGVYLREYARDGILSRSARVAVNNLAGVPSIVYGIFGLGFFVYGMGGSIDRLLYPERVAAGISTYGGGGIIWSSLTLGLLTLPVVIVATEEALATVPSEIRHGSLALGATRFQTLCRVVLPMASPGILTGFILAMARAAGEVAPLMLTGAVKSAHSLPLDGEWPFVHVERKFMHLGFHIYDMGFQSPNVEASKPLVYLTALILLILVFVLNFAAIGLRKRMREKYAMRGF
ncbi:MAG: phosphate ABC transporter permease PstA [Planctomycetota bacterium]|jgi:phosphate transport system permease protein|nr:phosphate ABC transporter permease PstA [Planctomycetota bacterium]